MPDTLIPKHQRLERKLRDLIESGRLQPGQRLPSEINLASEHAFSPGTVRRALATLIQEGLLQARRRSGVYVQEKPRQKIIGVLVPNVVNPDHARLVEAVAQGAAERGYSPVLFCSSRDWKQYRNDKRPQFQFVERMAALNPVGLIACPTHVPDEERLRARIRELNIPYVVTNDYWTDCRRDQHVCADQEAAARLAVDHLAGLGHRRIALWMVPGDEWAAAGRAFLDQMESLGLRDGAVDVIDSPARWVARFLHEGPDRPTAVIVPYYERSCRFLDALRAKGLQAPGDLSVVCLGGVRTPHSHGVDFTATISPIEEVAARALRMLLEPEKNTTCHYRYNPTLHVGATTAAAAVDAPEECSVAQQRA